MKAVSSKWSRSSTGKFTLFLDFLADFCGNMDFELLEQEYCVRKFVNMCIYIHISVSYKNFFRWKINFIKCMYSKHRSFYVEFVLLLLQFFFNNDNKSLVQKILSNPILTGADRNYNNSKKLLLQNITNLNKTFLTSEYTIYITRRCESFSAINVYD